MALQDDYIKTALRLPRELHLRLLDAAKGSSKSMNAEIVARLTASFEAHDGAQQKTLNALVKRQEELTDVVRDLQALLEAQEGKHSKRDGTKR